MKIRLSPFTFFIDLGLLRLILYRMDRIFPSKSYKISHCNLHVEIIEAKAFRIFIRVSLGSVVGGGTMLQAGRSRV
jgi:hypothetical protein